MARKILSLSFDIDFDGTPLGEYAFGLKRAEVAEDCCYKQPLVVVGIRILADIVILNEKAKLGADCVHCFDGLNLLHPLSRGGIRRG